MKENWVRKHIADICDKASSNIAQNKLEGLNGDYPIYGASGYVQNVDFYHRDKAYIGVVKDGSGVGRVNVYPAYSSLLGTMQYILPKEGFSLQFVAYALKSLNLASFASGAAIPHIYFKDYGQCEILVPPTKEEQEQVVAELDLLSGVIDKQKAQLKELDNLAQSTFYDMFGDPIENPKGWEVKKIKEIAIVRPPKSEARNMLNDDEFVSFFPMEELGIKKMNAYSTKEKKLKDALAGSYSFFCDNDVLLAKVTPCFENGKSGIARQLKNGVGFGSSEIIAFRCMSILIPEYLYSCFQCESFLEKGEKCMTGTSGLRRLSKPFVEDTLLAVPPLALQQSFADKITSIEKQKAALTQSIAETQKLLDYTMDKYFG